MKKVNTAADFLAFLKKRKAFGRTFEWVKLMEKDWEECYRTCESGEFLAWLYKETNPEDKRRLVLLGGLFARKTSIEFLVDERLLKAVDVSIAYGQGVATDEELLVAKEEADIAVREIIENEGLKWGAREAAFAARAVPAALPSSVASWSAGGAALAALAEGCPEWEDLEDSESREKDNAKWRRYRSKYDAQMADIVREIIPFEEWSIS
jgi:hypothetical protein